MFPIVQTSCPGISCDFFGFLDFQPFSGWESQPNCSVYRPNDCRWSQFCSASPMWMASSGFFSFRKRQEGRTSNQSLMIIQPCVSFYFMIWLKGMCGSSTVCFFLRIYFSSNLFNRYFIVSIHKFCQCQVRRLRSFFGLCCCSKIWHWQLPSNVEKVQFHTQIGHQT